MRSKGFKYDLKWSQAFKRGPWKILACLSLPCIESRANETSIIKVEGRDEGMGEGNKIVALASLFKAQDRWAYFSSSQASLDRDGKLVYEASLGISAMGCLVWNF